MKHVAGSFSVLLLSWLSIVGNLSAQELLPGSSFLPSGHWKFSETYQNDAGEQHVVWAFEFVDDKSPTITAIGRRIETNGERTRDRSVAILFIDKRPDGALSGSYIEAFGDGDQIELGLKIEKSDDDRYLKLIAFDRAGEEISVFEGDWLGRGLKSQFQEGDWEVREIVSPGKGRWDIEWKYSLADKEGKITGKGNKVRVNQRKAYSGERRTYCRVNLSRDAGNENAVKGTGVETNHRGKSTKASYEGWISPSGRTFFLMSYESDGLAGLLVGRFSEQD